MTTKKELLARIEALERRIAVFEHPYVYDVTGTNWATINLASMRRPDYGPLGIDR